MSEKHHFRVCLTPATRVSSPAPVSLSPSTFRGVNDLSPRSEQAPLSWSVSEAPPPAPICHRDHPAAQREGQDTAAGLPSSWPSACFLLETGTPALLASGACVLYPDSIVLFPESEPPWGFLGGFLGATRWLPALRRGR